MDLNDMYGKLSEKVYNNIKHRAEYDQRTTNIKFWMLHGLTVNKGDVNLDDCSVKAYEQGISCYWLDIEIKRWKFKENDVYCFFDRSPKEELSNGVKTILSNYLDYARQYHGALPDAPWLDETLPEYKSTTIQSGTWAARPRQPVVGELYLDMNC